MSDSSLSVFDDTDSDPDFIIDGMRTDSSLSVSDFDEEIYRKLIENDQKVNDNNNSNTCTFSNINKQVTSYNILTYDSDGNNNNNYHFNGFEQNHNIPSTSLCVIEPSSTDEEDNIVDSERKGKKRRRRLSLWNRNKAKTSK
ncbi:Reverse transcriptase domain-containing protein, partial [Aphis craccivora]